MIREGDLDRILTDWLSEGPERAPADDVASALATIAATPQRRGWFSRPPSVRIGHSARWRFGLILAALLVAIAGLAISAGPGHLDSPPRPVPGPSARVPMVEPAAQVFMGDGGLWRLALPRAWKPLPGSDGEYVRGAQRLSVQVGTDDGSILTCTMPVGTWERCRDVRVANLEDLEAAVEPGAFGTDEHPVSGPHRQTGSLGGEPSVITTIRVWQSATRGPDEVAYIVAMHKGRPYILRTRTTGKHVRDMQLIIEGFSFRD